MGRFYNWGRLCLAIKGSTCSRSVAEEVSEQNHGAKAAKLRLGLGSAPAARSAHALERQLSI